MDKDRAEEGVEGGAGGGGVIVNQRTGGHLSIGSVLFNRPLANSLPVSYTYIVSGLWEKDSDTRRLTRCRQHQRKIR